MVEHLGHLIGISQTDTVSVPYQRLHGNQISTKNGNREPSRKLKCKSNINILCKHK